MIDPAQLRAARALLGWSQQELAARCDMDVNTIKNFEKKGTGARSNPTRSTLLAWRKAFADAGVVFVDEDEGWGSGVRFRKPRK